MNEFELEQMLNGVVASVANVDVPQGFEERMKSRSFAINTLEMDPHRLTFGTLDRVNAGRQTRKTAAGALFFHAAVLLLVFFETRALHSRMSSVPTVESEVVLNAPLPPRPPLPPSAKAAGGGGGSTGSKPVTHGTPPKPAQQQVMPPQIKPVEDAKLPVEARIIAQPMMQLAPLPQVGAAESYTVGAASLGDGHGTGIGSGDGAGIGAGIGGNMGGGLFKIGGGVSAPIPIDTPAAEFSEEARKAHVSGNVLVTLVVDEQGRPSRVRVLKGMGMGLDEKAIEAVKQYRFKPAMSDGKPVAVEMNVEVNFQIF